MASLASRAALLRLWFGGDAARWWRTDAAFDASLQPFLALTSALVELIEESYFAETRDSVMAAAAALVYALATERRAAGGSRITGSEA